MRIVEALLLIGLWVNFGAMVFMFGVLRHEIRIALRRNHSGITGSG